VVAYIVKKKHPLKTDEREKVAIWLDNSQLAVLRAIQQNEMIPVSASIRRAIDEYLERRKKKS
jgi:hypothetical protein